VRDATPRQRVLQCDGGEGGGSAQRSTCARRFACKTLGVQHAVRLARSLSVVPFCPVPTASLAVVRIVSASLPLAARVPRFAAPLPRCLVCCPADDEPGVTADLRLAVKETKGQGFVMVEEDVRVNPADIPSALEPVHQGVLLGRAAGAAMPRPSPFSLPHCFHPRAPRPGPARRGVQPSRPPFFPLVPQQWSLRRPALTGPLFARVAPPVWKHRWCSPPGALRVPYAAHPLHMHKHAHKHAPCVHAQSHAYPPSPRTRFAPPPPTRAPRPSPAARPAHPGGVTGPRKPALNPFDLFETPAEGLAATLARSGSTRPVALASSATLGRTATLLPGEDTPRSDAGSVGGSASTLRGSVDAPHHRTAWASADDAGGAAHTVRHQPGAVPAFAHTDASQAYRGHRAEAPHGPNQVRCVV
jgi:hypothetical protein